MGRKAQVTVFIIIGIIALLSVGVFLYMRSAKVEAPITYRPTIEQIPVEAEPIRQYISSCVTQTAEEGLRKIGDYGGYTSKENMAASLNPVEPTSAEAVQFSPGGGLTVPYWWHLESDVDCVKCKFGTKRPNLYRSQGGMNIEEQLDEYVNENLGSCLRDFVDASEYGFEISEAGDVETKTVITEESVAFHVQYPVIAEKAGVSYQINEYFVDIPLNLKEIYELGSSLVNLQATNSYLEYYLINTIALYSRVDRNALPPFSATGFDAGGGVFWIVPEVEQRVKELFVSYIPLLRVMNTMNAYGIDFGEDTAYRNARLTLWNNNMLIPLVNESHNNLGVYFTYLDWWNPYFDISPCDGIVCKSESVSAITDFVFFLQRYHFNYDIAMPILVNIVNPNAFLGRGYSFKFFMEANVRNNKPVVEKMPEPLEKVPVPATGTMLCDPNKRNAKNITIRAFDTLSAAGVADADVNFECGGGESCPMGRTDGDGLLTADFPVCVGGRLIVDKSPEYHTGIALLNTQLGNFNFDVNMHPYMKKDIKVMKYKLVKQRIGGESQWVLRETPIILNNGEQAIVVMKRTNPGEAPFTTFAEYTGDLSDEDISKDIRIIPGTYDVSISLLNRNELLIPAREECYEAGLGDEVCVDIPEMEFGEPNPLFSGSVELSGIRLSVSSLLNNDVIVLYVISVAIEDLENRKLEDLEPVADMDVYSQNYFNILQPTFETKGVEVQRGATQTVIT